MFYHGFENFLNDDRLSNLLMYNFKSDKVISVSEKSDKNLVKTVDINGGNIDGTNITMS